MTEYKCPKCGNKLYYVRDNGCDLYCCDTCNVAYILARVMEPISWKESKEIKNKIPCSGKKCCMNHHFKPSECVLFDECQFYTPEEDRSVEDFSGLESIIEMAEKEFNIMDDIQKKKLRILMNAYVTEYLATTCKL